MGRLEKLKGKPGYISIADLCEYLACSPQTIHRHIREGLLPAVWMGAPRRTDGKRSRGMWRIPCQALDEYLKPIEPYLEELDRKDEIEA